MVGSFVRPPTNRGSQKGSQNLVLGGETGCPPSMPPSHPPPLPLHPPSPHPIFLSQVPKTQAPSPLDGFPIFTMWPSKEGRLGGVPHLSLPGTCPRGELRQDSNSELRTKREKVIIIFFQFSCKEEKDSITSSSHVQIFPTPSFLNR